MKQAFEIIQINMEDLECTFYAVNDPSYQEDSESSENGWIQWLCALEDHEFLTEVDEDYVQESFNLYGLRSKFPHFSESLQMLLSEDFPEDEDLQNESFLALHQEAVDLYGLIHRRFILSAKGLAMMREKHLSGQFGVCPKVTCERYNVLPVGLSEELKVSRVKVYCPRCSEVYVPALKGINLDGAYFGCSFPHVFLQSYPDLRPTLPNAPYVPKIYGFKLYKQEENEALTGGDKENMLK